jgi:hypothetical protein
MTRQPSPRVLSQRLAHASDRARAGDDVVIVVDKLAHVGQMMEALQQARGAVDLQQVDRRHGGEQLRYRGGGRIRFAPAGSPDSLRGWGQVDLFLVDPRVATSTALEENMMLACRRDPDRYAIITATVVRPGDRITIGGHVR